MGVLRCKGRQESGRRNNGKTEIEGKGQAIYKSAWKSRLGCGYMGMRNGERMGLAALEGDRTGPLLRLDHLAHITYQCRLVTEISLPCPR